MLQKLIEREKVDLTYSLKVQTSESGCSTRVVSGGVVEEQVQRKEVQMSQEVEREASPDAA